MNKPYFTKYIPVEGEIKDGQLGWSINNALYTHYEHLGPTYGKPVKLFLCGRDIQSEDYFNALTKIHIYHDGSFPPFKVIGEVSPNAIWVKEGMEFEEDQIDTKWWVHSDYWHMSNNGRPDATPGVQFKCPTCNRFH